MKEKMTLTAVLLTICLVVISTLTFVSTALAEVIRPTNIFDSTISLNPENEIAKNWQSQPQEWQNKSKRWIKRIPNPSRLPSIPWQPRPVPLPRIGPDPKPETLPAFPNRPMPVPL